MRRAGRSTRWLQKPASHTTIRQIWSALGLQPHRSQTFPLSRYPLFVDEMRDNVGFYRYLHRTELLCINEKSQIHLLDREQPVWPIRARDV
jgi:hypothetical protein